MARFNPTTYNPAADSSPGAQRVDNTLVLVYPDEFACRCGCKGKPKSPKRRFIQGHDARLKGALMRAAIAGAKVRIVEGRNSTDVTPQAAAKAFGFAPQVAQAKQRFTEVEKARAEKAKTRQAAAKKAPAKKATKASKAKASSKKAPAKRAAKSATPKSEPAQQVAAPEEGLTGASV